MPQPEPAFIETRQLSMSYPLANSRVEVLREVNITIAAGTRVAIAGPSGSGKTSLLLLLSGLERPSSGQVLVDGIDLGTLDADAPGRPAARARRHRVPALSPAAQPERAGQRGPAAADGRRGAMRARWPRPCWSAWASVAALDHLPSQLSGGEQQRVAIARALVHRPRLLLADEPTGNLDDHTGRVGARAAVRAATASCGTTLVLVTHDLDFAARCDRVLRLHDGQLHETPATASTDTRDALPA